MRRWIAVLLLVLTPAPLRAATITTAQTGPVNVTSTWAGGVIPGSGDLAVIADGHTLTHPNGYAWTVGDPANAANLAISSAGTEGTGIFVVEDGATLNLLSSVEQGNATWTVGRATIEYDNASAGTWSIGDAHSQANAALTITGTDTGNRAVVRSKSGGGKLRFTDGANLFRAGKVQARYVNFTRIGDASNNSFRYTPNTTADTYSWRDCTFDDCGPIGSSIGLLAASVFRFEDNLCVNCPTNFLGATISGSTALAGGTRSIVGNWFDGQAGTSGGGAQWKDFTITHNVFAGGFRALDSTTDFGWASLGWNVVKTPNSNASVAILANTSETTPNLLHVHGASTYANIRGLLCSAYRDVTVAGWLIEPGDTSSDGDVIMPGGPTAARVYTVRNNVLRANKDGNRAGAFVSCLGNANVTFAITHNTYFSDFDSGEGGSITVAETYAGHAGMVSAVKSNLVWSDTAGAGYVFVRRITGTVSDICSAANLSHNGKYNLSTGNVGVEGYGDKVSSPPAAMFSSTTGLGANDVTGNPAFVDETRTIATWAVARGYSVAADYATRQADAYTALKTDTRTRVVDLLNWWKAGYAPTNTAFRNAGHDAVTIGAVEGVWTRPDRGVPRGVRRGVRRGVADLLPRPETDRLPLVTTLRPAA